MRSSPAADATVIARWHADGSYLRRMWAALEHEPMPLPVPAAPPVYRSPGQPTTVLQEISRTG